MVFYSGQYTATIIYNSFNTSKQLQLSILIPSFTSLCFFLHFPFYYFLIMARVNHSKITFWLLDYPERNSLAVEKKRLLEINGTKVQCTE
jgi:hypothetical protein